MCGNRIRVCGILWKGSDLIKKNKKNRNINFGIFYSHYFLTSIPLSLLYEENNEHSQKFTYYSGFI